MGLGEVFICLVSLGAMALVCFKAMSIVNDKNLVKFNVEEEDENNPAHVTVSPQVYHEVIDVPKEPTIVHTVDGREINITEEPWDIM
jgi:hypothetical protein